MSRKKPGIFSKKKGFTLVELLVTVIIIGILAGMLLLSAGASTDSAKAARIIADLRSMKAAALMLDDNGAGRYGITTPTAMPPGSPDRCQDPTAKGEGYWVGAMRASDDHSIAFSVADLRELDDGVKRSIEKQADKVALYGDTFSGMPYQPEMDKLEKFNAEKHDMLLWIINK